LSISYHYSICFSAVFSILFPILRMVVVEEEEKEAWGNVY
jgi:hypothetical protein